MNRILYIWKSPYPWDIRVEKFCRTLGKNGFQVRLLSRWKNEINYKDNYNDFEVIRIGYQKPRILFTPYQSNIFWKYELNKQIQEFKPDLIIVREFFITHLVKKIVKNRNIPVIMDMAENYPAAMKLWEKYNSKFYWKIILNKFKLADKIEKNAVNSSDGIIVVCKEQIERLVSTYNYDTHKIEIVHNTNPKSVIKFTDKERENKKVVFSHHGYLTSEKPFYNFLIALSLALKKNSNLYMKIAGKGDCLNKYKEFVKNYGIEDNVQFIGEYKFDELPKILNDVDYGILFYPQNDFNNYTIHNKIFDYFSLGIPVIVSDAVPLKRLIDETNAGISVNYDNINELSEILSNLKSVDYSKFQLATNAANEMYNWEIDTNNLITFINKYL